MERRHRRESGFVDTAVKRRIGEREQTLFNLLHDHGEAPTSLLTPFLHKYYNPQSSRTDVYRAEQKAHDYNVRRMGTLYESGYLTIPQAQYEVSGTDGQHRWFGLTEYGRKLTENSPYAPRMNTKLFKHDAMYPVITLSIRHLAEQEGIEYIPQHKVVEKFKSLFFDDIVGHVLRPDGFFGLKFPNGKIRYHCVESDRGTEPIDSGTERKDIRRNYIQYRELIGNQKWKELMELTGSMVVLNITTKRFRVESMVDIAKKCSKSGKSTFSLYQSTDAFGKYHFETPKGIVDSFWTEPYLRAGHESFKLAISPA